MPAKSSKFAHSSIKERPSKKARTAEDALKKPSLKKLSQKPAPLKSSLKTRPPTLSTKKYVPKSTPKDLKGKSKATTALDDEETPTSLPTSFKVVAGSYEKLLYGLEGIVSVHGSSHEYTLKPMFIFPAHMSCIKAIAASPNGGKWLATGSADEIVKVWDLRRRKEIGGLMHHEGSITHLEFPSRSHLLSASEDGTLCLFRARDWSVLRSLKGHKGRVNSVAVHPSGKVGLSVGKDRMLRMWDLMRGKGSASTKLGKEGELVRWSTTGALFVVQTFSTLEIFSTEMALLHSITHTSRIHDVKFCKRVDGEGEVLLVAAEDKKVSIYDVPSDRKKVPTIIAEMVGHENRVKAVDTLSIALPPIPNNPEARSSTTIICTISSDGKVRLFDLASLPAKEPSPNEARTQLSSVGEYDTKGTRLTCMAIADGDVENVGGVNGKRKREKDEEEDDEEDDENEMEKNEDDDEDEEEENEEVELEGEDEESD